MTQFERDRSGVLAPDGWSLNTPSDRPLDHLSVFSAPGVEAVFQWWRESNRRWAERPPQAGRLAIDGRL
jgi:hypothetical protein